MTFKQAAWLGIGFALGMAALQLALTVLVKLIAVVLGLV